MSNPNVEQLLSSISSRQYAIWLAYWKLKPWGQDRADLRQAITSNLIAAQYTSKAKVSDFMPYQIVKQTKQTEQEQQSVCQLICDIQKVQEGNK